MGGLDEVRFLGGIPEYLADLRDRDFEYVGRDEDIRPDGGEQVLLRHELSRSLRQVPEHREGLRRQIQCVGATGQSAGDEIQVKRREGDPPDAGTPHPPPPPSPPTPTSDPSPPTHPTT